MTSRGLCAAAIGVVLSGYVDTTWAGSEKLRPVTVSFAPSEPQQGDVARIDVAGVDGDAQLTGDVLGQDLAFHFDAPQRVWRALVGIDLDTEPGAYPLRIEHTGGDALQRTLRVAPKQFRVRRLRVSGRFVDPPPDVLEQIARDSGALAEAYARTTSRLWAGKFVLPVTGRPSSNFGTRSYYNGQRRSPHAGVDFAGKPGTPIRAANHGEVVIAEPMYFTGNTVVIDHGDRLFSIFAHLSELHAKPGDKVESTTIIGLVGSTGRVTGPHLHWSVRLNGARVDPLSLVAATAGW